MTGLNTPRVFKDIAGIRTASYRKTPTGQGKPPTVLLLHGAAPGACSDLNWFRNMDVLAQAGYDVVTYDQPGYGHSAIPKDHSIEFRYRHAASFLESLDVESVHLIGNSVGGLLSTLLYHRSAQRNGPTIRSLVLAAPFPFFDAPASAETKLAQHRGRLSSIEPTFESIRALCLNTFNQADQVTDDIVELRLSMLQGERWAAHKARAGISREFDRASIREAVLDVPTLMIWGLQDRSLPCDIGVKAFDHFSNARFLFLPRCGHWPQTEQAEEFNRAVVEFLHDQE